MLYLALSQPVEALPGGVEGTAQTPRQLLAVEGQQTLVSTAAPPAAPTDKSDGISTATPPLASIPPSENIGRWCPQRPCAILNIDQLWPKTTSLTASGAPAETVEDMQNRVAVTALL
ncbi:g7553 [Coccomyxa viridis]|uniref:G7553 protein n=1 Tax=Coccomyxa viridis TaxID=1274662 RepID=A0ABP1FY77_9CHLO